MSHIDKKTQLITDSSYNYVANILTRKKLRILIIIISTSALVFAVIHSLNFLETPEYFQADQLIEEPRVFNILFWHIQYGTFTWYSDNNGQVTATTLKQHGCPVSNCLFTHDHHALGGDFTKFDVVIFHSPEKLSKMTKLPTTRNENQLFAFLSYEAPKMMQESDYSIYDNFYNITMTYRMDSDVYYSYGKLFDVVTNTTTGPGPNPKWRPRDENFFDEEILKKAMNKTKPIAWFTSRCDAWSHRMDLVKKMQTMIDVDIYGRCGPFKCGRTECENLLEDTYMFYLSFENQLCKDYASEKLFRALQHGAVPIVFNGIEDMTTQAPPHSYINANDYATAEDLVNYIKYLMDNPKEYIKYLWWTKHYRVRTYYNEIYTWCTLCQKLNDPVFMSQKHTYPSIKEWMTEGQCNNTPKIRF